jgi:hypothetical protein
MFERGKKLKRVFQAESCGSVHLRKINSCMPESLYRKKAELINRGFNVCVFHAQRSTLRRPRKIYWRGASPVRIVRVDDDAGVHACAPALGRAVGGPIRRLPILGGVGKRGGGKRGLERLAPNAVRERKVRKRGGGEERRV